MITEILREIVDLKPEYFSILSNPLCPPTEFFVTLPDGKGGSVKSMMARGNGESDDLRLLPDAAVHLSRLANEFHLYDLDNYNGDLDDRILQALRRKLRDEQDRGLGKCKRCETKNAQVDYNGHGYLVCRRCYDQLSDEFDEEYR